MPSCSPPRYGFVLATNFGVPARDAIGVVPAERDYPVLFLTGYVTEQIEKECVEMLRLALEDLRL